MKRQKRVDQLKFLMLVQEPAFQVFVDMANLHNKLKLLNYDDEYVAKWRMKPISRIHFAVPTNPGDQLHAFIALSAWLLQKGGIRFDKPSEVRLHFNKTFSSFFFVHQFKFQF